MQRHAGYHDQCLSAIRVLHISGTEKSGTKADRDRGSNLRELQKGTQRGNELSARAHDLRVPAWWGKGGRVPDVGRQEKRRAWPRTRLLC